MSTTDCWQRSTTTTHSLSPEATASLGRWEASTARALGEFAPGSLPRLRQADLDSEETGRPDAQTMIRNLRRVRRR
jgi:hypothetical protein